MPYNRKMYIPGQIYELCFRTEEGIPMSSAPFMVRILKGYLAAAQTMHPIRIIGCEFMANHIHVLARVIDPEDVPKFCEYFKRESAHAINRLLGRVNRTVWCSGYDSPIVLDASTMMNRLHYVYCNPMRADLTQTIDEYPHISSWEALKSGRKEKAICARLPRNKVPILPNGPLSDAQLDELDEYVKQNSVGEYELTFEPDAWLDCFEESIGSDPEKIRAEVIRRVREEETKLEAVRVAPVIGRERLMRQDVRQKHTPSNSPWRSHGRPSLLLRSGRFAQRESPPFSHATAARIAAVSIAP